MATWLDMAAMLLQCRRLINAALAKSPYEFFQQCHQTKRLNADTDLAGISDHRIGSLQ